MRRLALDVSMEYNDVRLIAEKLDFRLEGVENREEYDHTLPYRITTWKSLSANDSLHYIHDETLDVGYLVAEGNGALEIEQTLDEEALTCEPETMEAIMMAHRTGTRKYGFILKVLACNEFNEELLGYFQEMIKHEDDSLRLTAVIMMVFLCWAQFDDLLAELLLIEQDEEIRITAEKVKLHLAQVGWQMNSPLQPYTFGDDEQS